MKKIVVAIALGSIVLAAPALAQAPAGGGAGQRDQTRAEVQQRADMIFQMIDANHDGVVTRDEAQQAAARFAGNGGAGGGRMQRVFERAFGTADSISLQQFEGMMLARFDAMDLNHDGIVTAAEREQFREQREAARGMRAAPPAGAVTQPVPSTSTPPRV